MEKWFNTYFQKLVQFGVSEDAVNRLKETYGEKIKVASFATKSDTGFAYEGSLVDVVLTKVAIYAVNLNNLYPEYMRVDQNSLLKVCLLQPISMAERTVKNNDKWREEHLGEVFSYNANNPAIGVGVHSLVMATSCGITFTPIEAEAMTIMDKSDDDMQAKFHSSLMSSIVKQANEMAINEGKANAKK